jgi:hypothetical protein
VNLERAAAEKKAASCSQTPSQPTGALWRSGPKLICRRLGPRPRTIWARPSGILERAAVLQEVVSYHADDVSRYRLASALGSLAFHLILDRHFAEAGTRCEEAQRLANEIGDGIEKTDRDNLIFIQQNVAHALLFQGHYGEALTIYREDWNKPLHGKIFGEVTLEDFAAFDKAGPNHPDLCRMKQALGERQARIRQTEIRTVRNFVLISADSILCVSVSWTGTKQCS